jgi:spore maturation protein CgeB
MLGLNCQSDKSVTQTSCRPYESLASSSNSAYLAYYTEAQNRIFGDYIIQVNIGIEMINKAKEILEWSDKKRKDFAKKAREFVIREHNYEIRVKKILKVLGG